MRPLRWLAAVLAATVAIPAHVPADTPIEGSRVDPLAHTISLDVQDAELVNVLRLIADVTELNVIIDPSIHDKVTLKLEDVSWRQFLDLLLRMHGLGKLEQGNVLWIAPLDHPAFQPRAAPRSSEPLETRIVQVRYAKATDLKPILEQATMSSDGSVTVDARTNTLILRDHPPNLREALRLIGHR